jgi:hypothetical protein
VECAALGCIRTEIEYSTCIRTFGTNPKVCEELGPKHCFSSLSIYHSIPICRDSYPVYNLYRYDFLNIPSLASLTYLAPNQKLCHMLCPVHCFVFFFVLHNLTIYHYICTKIPSIAAYMSQYTLVGEPHSSWFR